MASDSNPLKDVSNVRLFNMVRNDLSTDFRSRIPAATKGSMSDTLANLQRFRPMMNEFMDGLVNRIGSVIARTDSLWENPLSEFKSARLEYGSTIEEYQVGLLHAHVYDHDREDLEKSVWGTELPPMESNFHTINRQEKYKISVKQDILRRAFLQEGGLSNFVEQMMVAPIKSDNWDEFLQTCRLFSEYENNGGFYHMRVPDLTSDNVQSEQARYALRRMRALADTFTFLSTRYNAAHMPVHADPSDLVIFCTPEFKAAVDVEALAAAFHMEKMDTYGRIIPIPREYFNIEGCEAVLTTRNFFVIADALKENTSIYNPANLQTNYWLHHHEIISASRFVPAVMFSLNQDDEKIEVTPVEVTGISDITFSPQEDGTTPKAAMRGEFVQLVAIPQGKNAENTGLSWRVDGHNSARTWISPTGVLHVGGDETADDVTVTATSSWVDPKNPHKAPLTKSTKISVKGDPIPVWPDKRDKPKPPKPSGTSGS